MRRNIYGAAILGAILLSSCGDGRNEQSHGAIVLGDSASIVTERDSQYLRDNVADLEMRPEPKVAPVVKQELEIKDTVATAAATQAKQQAATPPPQQQAAPANGKGLNADFGDISVFIPNIETRSFGKHNNNGAAFQLSGGNLNGNQLRISGGTAQKVTQRYQTSVILHNQIGTLLLETLNYTSDWETLKGNGASYTISGLDERRLQYTNANRNKIQDAVTRALRAKRYSYKKQQQYLGDVRNARSVKDDPLEVILRTVIWQIEGKDKAGKSFRKELRIDIPVR